MTNRQYRTIFVSDLHLGTKNSNINAFLDFLRNTECDYLYLLGDMIDTWNLNKRWQWPAIYNEVFEEILKKAAVARVVYVLGNHDEDLRRFLGTSFGNISVSEKAYHTLANGKKCLILHGDQFDIIVNQAKWLAKLGGSAYMFGLSLSYFLTPLKRRINKDSLSLASYLKHKVKNAISYIGHYKEAIKMIACQEKVDVVVCGHIHYPELSVIDDKIIYANTGDWIEQNSAVVEDYEGNLQVIKWSKSK